MSFRMNWRVTLLPVLVLVTACAVRLGGPLDVEFRVLFTAAEPGVTAEQVAARIAEQDARVTIVGARRDTTWFAELATLSGFELSGPGGAAESAFGFLAGSPVGDTTVTLFAGERELIVHDALYRVDQHGPQRRLLNLLALQVEAGTDLRRAVRTLLEYIASDVMHNAGVVMAVQLSSPEAGDTLGSLLRPLLQDVRGCLPEPAQQQLAGLRLFVGPELRVECKAANLVNGSGQGILARIVVPR